MYDVQTHHSFCWQLEKKHLFASFYDYFYVHLTMLLFFIQLPFIACICFSCDRAMS